MFSDEGGEGLDEGFCGFSGTLGFEGTLLEESSVPVFSDGGDGSEEPDSEVVVPDEAESEEVVSEDTASEEAPEESAEEGASLLT